MPTNDKKVPMTVFLGSSSQSRMRFDLDKTLVPKLRKRIEKVRPWWTVFEVAAGKTVIQTLIEEAVTSDLAILVMAQDDLTQRADGSLVFTVRDNVTFELGLFAGALGLDRSLMVVVPEAAKGCDLRLMVASDSHPEKEIIDKFEREFEPKKTAYAVLIVHASNDSNKWTVAGFNDAGEFRTVVIDNPDHELSKELTKDPANQNRSRIAELAISSLGRTPAKNHPGSTDTCDPKDTPVDTSAPVSPDYFQIPSDLDGVTQIRWNREKSWDGVVDRIAHKANERFDRLGLGWWIMESLNRSAKPPRSMFGIFKIVSFGKGVRVQDGVLHYGTTFHALGILGEVRERWHSIYAAFTSDEKFGHKLMIVADVHGHPQQIDPLPEAHIAGNFKTVYQAEQSGDEGWLFGKFFNIENLTFKGDATFRRLGAVTERDAFWRAVIEFAPALLLKQSPCLKRKLEDAASKLEDAADSLEPPSPS
jgi:predicted nucleotide-binding protein